MSPWRSLLSSAVVAAVVAGGVAFLMTRKAAAPAAPGLASYQRLVASKTVRCGYIQNPPYFVRDPNTGEVKGLTADVLQTGLRQAGYKIRFVEEVGWATAIPGLQADRYDVLCSAIWRNSARAQSADFSSPFFFNGIGGFVRSNDPRFSPLGSHNQHYAEINSKSVTVATMDGEITSLIADQDFPKAKRLASPQSSALSQMLLNVADGKADITFVEPLVAANFLKTHPGSLRNLFEKDPVRVYPVTFMVAKGNYALKGFLDAMIGEEVDGGIVDRLIKANGLEGGFVYPVATGYRQAEPVTGSSGG